MAMVLCGKPIISEFRPVPIVTNHRGKPRSARLTIMGQHAQEHKPMALTLRREAMIGMTACVAVLLFPPPSEARISKAEMKKKVMETLRQLRAKAGLTEPETKEKSATVKIEEGKKEAPLGSEKKMKQGIRLRQLN